MNTKLVEILKHEVYCDSHMVAKKFNRQHARVVDRIKQVQSDIEGISMHGVHPKISIEDRIYRGQGYTAYLMNRDFFSFLMMKFKGKAATKCQLAFIAAFNLMEIQLIIEKTNAADSKWLGHRKLLTDGRKKETDVIKEFVEYATLQGSKKASFYYKHITNATYRALGLMIQKNPKLRDTMNLYEISELLLAERVAQSALKKYMALKRDYHDIYNSVKDDLMTLAGGLKIN